MIYFFYPPFLPQSSISWTNYSISSQMICESAKRNQALPENKMHFSPTILHVPTPAVSPSPLKSLTRFSTQKVVSLEKKRTQDEDYNPDCQVPKKNKKSKQLENRNVVPNVVRLVLSYVQKPGKSSKFVEKLLQKKPCSGATVKRFFLYHKLVKAHIDNYVHENTLTQLVQPRPEHSDLYSDEEQELYNSITRKLIVHFLEHQARICVLTSKRMDQSKKQEHVEAIRGLIVRFNSKKISE